MSDTYWLERMKKAQKNISDKEIAQIEKQLTKMYKSAMEQTVNDFELTYAKVLTSVKNDVQPTPADLYKLNKYWKMQAQLKNTLADLGDKEAELLSKHFEKTYDGVYKSLSLDSGDFATLDKLKTKQVINQVWCADGKSWSSRIWSDKEKLANTLNEQLVNCVVTCKSTTQLVEMLRKRFNTSYFCANRITRTEIAHIETQAALDRYKDYGIKKYKFCADTDEQTCSICSRLDGKEFNIEDMQAGVNAPPMHPNDRCCIIPVVEDDIEPNKKQVDE